MATSDTGFEGDVDLYKNSRKMMAAMLMRKLQQQNPSLGGNVLNALALGIMGYAEKRDEERGAKGLGDVRKALEDAGVTTPSTTTPSTTTPPTKAESAPTSEPGPRTETPSVMAGKYPAAETGTSRPSTSRMTMPDLTTTPAGAGDRPVPPTPMLAQREADQFYGATGAAPSPIPTAPDQMVPPSLNANVAFGGATPGGPVPSGQQALAAALLGGTPMAGQGAANQLYDAAGVPLQNTFAERFAGAPPLQGARPMMGPQDVAGVYDATGAANAPPDMMAGVRARAATMGPALGPPPSSRPQATEMDRGPVYPPPPGGEDWGPPNGYRGPGAPLPSAPAAPAAPAMSPEWQRLQEYQRSQGQAPQPPPPPAMMRPGGAPPISPGAGPGPQSMVVPPAAPSPPSGPPQGGRDPYSAAISRLESGGFKDPYTAMGPPVRTQGGVHQAIGKYQVMDFNVGPWTEKHLGQRMTPEEFRRSPDAQEAVFKGQFGEYVQKYGPERAARAWIGGEGGVDNPNARAVSASGKPIGLSVGEYSTRFANALGSEDRGRAPAAPVSQPAPYQVAQAGGGPPPGPPQATPQRPGQAVIDQLRRLADTHPDPEVRNRANSIIIQQRLQELQPPEVTWQERGGDKVPFSVDRRTGQIRQVPIAGEEKPQMAGPGQVGVPPPPPGVDPKKWRETMSTEMAKRAMGETIPVEAAGRLAMMQTTQKDFQSTRKELEGGWDATKRAQYLAYRAGQGWAAGDTGRALRNVDVAIESALRAMTGAAAPPAELASYRDKFMPTPFDDEKSRKQKLDLLEDFMSNASKNIMQGRGMQAPDLGVRQSPAEAARAVTGGWSIRRVQ